MELLTSHWHVWLAISSLWVASILYVRRPRSGESVLSKVFQSNEDLDTTLGILLRGAVVFAVLSIVVIFFSMFHGDLDESDVGMLAMHVVSLAGNSITLVAVVNSNGPDKKDKQDEK